MFRLQHPSPTSQSSHQHISSQTSVTNIDLAHFKPVMTSLKTLRSDLKSVWNVLHWLFKMWRWTKIGKSYFHAKVNFDLVDEQMWRHFWYFLQFLEKALIETWGIITEFDQRVIIREIFEEISMKMSRFSWFLVILVVA